MIIISKSFFKINQLTLKSILIWKTIKRILFIIHHQNLDIIKNYNVNVV